MRGVRKMLQLYCLIPHAVRLYTSYASSCIRSFIEWFLSFLKGLHPHPAVSYRHTAIHPRMHEQASQRSCV